MGFHQPGQAAGEGAFPLGEVLAADGFLRAAGTGDDAPLGIDHRHMAGLQVRHGKGGEELDRPRLIGRQGEGRVDGD